MTSSHDSAPFEVLLQRPVQSNTDASWTFVILPKTMSDTLPRRGRTTVEGTLNGHPFQATLEPDGQLSHWFKLPEGLRQAAGVSAGETVMLEIMPMQEEPEPELPDDLQCALSSCPEALEVWADTTTLARVDWIHWITSSKQAKTRAKRIHDACDKLASGTKRVCCFDPSGHYSKAFSAPEAQR